MLSAAVDIVYVFITFLDSTMLFDSSRPEGEIAGI